MAKTVWIGDVRKGVYDDQEIEIKGWITRSSYGRSNKLRFVVLRDSTGTLQCVGKLDILGEELFSMFNDALVESSVVFSGTVLRNERAPGGRELSMTGVEIIGAVDPERP
ncbi:MAG TPA: asparagine--tRNA ligase, partial [Candidatus Poseidoniales archaeon]